MYLSPTGNWSCHCLAEHLNCVGRSWGLLCCHLFNPGSLLWLLTFTWVPFPFPASMTEALPASAFLRQQVLIQAVHVWGWSSVPCVGHFVCAGHMLALVETSGTSVEGEQPDTLPWLPAACVQASSPAGVGSSAGVISQFNPFSTIPSWVAHSHTSRKGKTLTCLLLWAVFFSCDSFRFEKPLEWLGQEGKGAGSGHGCTYLQQPRATSAIGTENIPFLGSHFPVKATKASYPHPPVERTTKLIQWGWLKEPRAVPQAPFLASVPLRRAMPWLIPGVLLPPTFPGLGGEPKPDPWDVTLLWITNCYGCPGLFVSTIQCCLIPFCVHSGRPAGILWVGSCCIRSPGEKEGETTNGKVLGVEMCVHMCLAFMRCSCKIKNISDRC